MGKTHHVLMAIPKDVIGASRPELYITVIQTETKVYDWSGGMFRPDQGAKKRCHEEVGINTV